VERVVVRIAAHSLRGTKQAASTDSAAIVKQLLLLLLLQLLLNHL